MRISIFCLIFLLATVSEITFSSQAYADGGLMDADGVTPCDRKIKIDINLHGYCTDKGRTKITRGPRKNLTCNEAGTAEGELIYVRDLPGNTIALPNGTRKCENVGGMTSSAMTEKAANIFKTDRKRTEQSKDSKLCPEGGTPNICWMKDPKDEKKKIYLHSAKENGDELAKVIINCDKASAYLWYRCEKAGTSADAEGSTKKICFNSESGLNDICFYHVAAGPESVTPTPTPAPLLEESMCEMVSLAFETDGIEGVRAILLDQAGAESLLASCNAQSELENLYYSVPAVEIVIPLPSPTVTASPTVSATPSVTPVSTAIPAKYSPTPSR